MFFEPNEEIITYYPENYNKAYKDVIKIIRTNRYSIFDTALLFKNIIKDLEERAVISEIRCG